MYSIKTDLGIAGSTTVSGDMLVKGDAVFEKNLTVNGTVIFANATFTQITVTGAAQFGSVNVTGAAKVAGKTELLGDTVLGTSPTNNISVKGKLVADAGVEVKGAFVAAGATTLGTSSTDAVVINGATTVNADANLTKNVIVGTTGTNKLTVKAAAEFENNVTVKGVTRLDGNLNMPAGTKATFQDVTINGTLDGSYTINTGNFTNINVSGNIVAGPALTSRIEGPRVLVTGGENGLIEFSQKAAAGKISTSIKPTEVASTNVRANTSAIERGVFGDETYAYSDPGLIAKGAAKIDYLQITGNPTLGTSQPLLDVKGNSKFSGKAIVNDLQIDGALSGNFSLDISGKDINPRNVTSTGNVVAVNVTASEKVSSKDISATGTTTLNNLNVTGTITGNFPGGVDGNDIAPRKVTINAATGAGLIVASGVPANIHTVTSTAINNSATITTKDLVVTGTITGAIPGVDGQDILPNKVGVTTDLTVGGNSTLKAVTATTVTATGIVKGSSLEGTTVKATGAVTAATVTSSGVTKALSVETAKIEAAPSGAGEFHIASNAVADKDFEVKGTFKSASLDLTGSNLTGITSISTTGNANVGGDLTVTGALNASSAAMTVESLTATTFVKGEQVQGTTVTATGLVKGANVEATASVKGVTLNATTEVVTPTAQVATIQGGAGGTGTVTLASNAVASKDLTVNGQLILNGSLDLSTADIATNDLHVNGNLTVDGTFALPNTELAAQSLKTTTVAEVGTDLVVKGTMTVNGASTVAALTAATLTSTGKTTAGTLDVTGLAALKGAATVGTTLGVTGVSTFTGAVNAGAINASGLVTVTGATTSVKALKADSISSNTGNLNLTGAVVAAGNLTVNGTLTPAGGLDISGATVNAGALVTTGNVTVGGNLAVTGTFDQSALDVTVKSLTTTGLVKGGSIESTGTLKATGITTLGVVNTTGKVTAASLDVTGASTFNTVSASASISANGGITASGATVNFAKPISVTGDASVSKVLTIGAVATPSTTNSVVVNGSQTISGDLDVSGTIKGAIDFAAREITAQKLTSTTSIVASQGITAGTSITAKTGVLGEVGGPTETNVLQVNGSMLVTGKITGQLDMSTSVVDVKGINASEDVTIARNLIMTKSTGANVTGRIEATDLVKGVGLESTTTLKVAGVSTLAGTTVTTLGVSGAMTAKAITSDAAIQGLNLIATNKVTTKDLEVTGVITADIADLVTKSVTTSTYFVKNKVEETVSTATYTPDGSSNVYNVLLTANTQILPPVGMTPGKAGSWFIYVKQDATGGRTVNWGGGLSVVGGEVNTGPGTVSICNIVYCGIGNVYDVFIAQRK